MQPYICDFSAYSLPKKLIYLSLSISTAEILTYPFDRIKTYLFAKPYNLTKSLLGYREFHLTTLEIYNVEKFFGLFFGLKAGFDRTFSLVLPKFLMFYYLLKPKKPEDLTNFTLFNYSLIIHTLGGCISQLSNVLKVKLQTEPLDPSIKKLDSISMKYRAISEIYSKDKGFLFRCGLGSSLLHINLMGLTELFGFLTIKKGIDFIDPPLKDHNKAVISVIIASALATILLNPLEFIHHKIVLEELKGGKIENTWGFIENIKKKRGILVFYQGFLPNLLMNCCFNGILVWILLKGLRFEQRKDHEKTFRHQGRYNNEA